MQNIGLNLLISAKAIIVDPKFCNKYSELNINRFSVRIIFFPVELKNSNRKGTHQKEEINKDRNVYITITIFSLVFLIKKKKNRKKEESIAVV